MLDKKKNTVEAASVTLTSELKAQRKYIKQLQTSRKVDLKAQRKAIEELGDAASTLGFVDEANFVESMRDLGYKNTAFALAELVDNSIQAGASQVHVVLHCKKGSKVTTIAVIDDGHGMDPKMILESVRWGGTHRHKDRSGFGRFGMGKPSACVSQGRRFTSFSKTEDGELHSVAVDLDEIADGMLKGDGGRLKPPPIAGAEERAIPNRIREYRESNGLDGDLDCGTVVIIEKVDKATKKTLKSLERHLLEWLGVIYRYYIGDIKLFVNGKPVEVVDPLFTLPGHRDPAREYHDDVAEDRGVIRFEVRDPETKESQGWVRVRFSRLPVTFPRVDKERGVGLDKDNANFRGQVIIGHNKGIHILRKGRLIYVLATKCPWTTFLNNDRYWGCEIDFDPGLDDEFELNSSKQQVVPSDRMWKLLEDAGVYEIIGKLRKIDALERKALKTKKDATDKDGKRASEKAAEDAEKRYGSRRAETGTAGAKKKAKENTEREAKKRAKASGRDRAEIDDELREEIRKRTFKLEEADFPPGSPFFACESRTADDDDRVQIVVALNRKHRFYSDVYAHDDTTPHTRIAIESVLFSLARQAAVAEGEREVFYSRAISEWSNTLDGYLFELAKYNPDDADAEADDDDATAVDTSVEADKGKELGDVEAVATAEAEMVAESGK